MKSTSDPSFEIDDVERCRRTRRTLEQTHGGFGGLCDWIEKLERQRTAGPLARADADKGRRKGSRTR